MNKPVSRTNSAGCSPLSHSFDNARRHSAAGLRALAWTSSSAFSCSVGSEGRSSRDSLRGIVVTPDSIPQFTIPKLAVEDHYRSKGQTSTEDLTGSPHLHSPSSSLSSSASSSSSPFSLSPALSRKAHRCASDPETVKRLSLRRESSISCALMVGEHCHDPTTKAALSLPHLPKITTPYGFITLSQSPQMANEEELLLQAGHRRWARHEEHAPFRNTNLETRRNSSVRTLPIHVCANAPKKQLTAKANTSWETSGHSGSLSSKVIQSTTSRPKRSLWGVLRKHLTSQKDSKWDNNSA